jgi:hypothetical protein
VATVFEKEPKSVMQEERTMLVVQRSVNSPPEQNAAKVKDVVPMFVNLLPMEPCVGKLRATVTTMNFVTVLLERVPVIPFRKMARLATPAIPKAELFQQSVQTDSVRHDHCSVLQGIPSLYSTIRLKEVEWLLENARSLAMVVPCIVNHDLENV